MRAGACASLAVALSACTAGGDVPASAAKDTAQVAFAASAHGVAGQQKIRHVIIVMQENRSFDDLFNGFPGADTVRSGLTSDGKRVALQSIPLTAPYDIGHDKPSHDVALDGGKMDGFDKEVVGGSTRGYHHPQYGFVPHAETKPYFAIGNQYVVADRMFTSHVDASFVSHQYIIAGQAQESVDLPTGSWGCYGGSGDYVQTLDPQTGGYGNEQVPCFDYPTLAQRLDRAGLSWRFYAAGADDVGSIWSAYQAIQYVVDLREWATDVINPPSQILDDVANGELANVTWVTPTWATSDHGGAGTTQGPGWIASIVNAVGRSKFWDSTAIFVMWDEWGGWYDHVVPPVVDYDGLGFRVPLLIVSPYAKKGFVSHTQFEHGSILRFVEDDFGLQPMAASDARANDPAADCFEFGRKPRAFSPIPGALTRGSLDRPATPADGAMPD
jgi:phospholipase C